jgi:hypothetical protein
MSTLGLSVGGGATGAAIGGMFGPAGLLPGYIAGQALGATAGGALDSYVIFPALFPKPDLVAGTRLTDLAPFQSVAEGGPLHYVLGKRNRVSGQLIWVDKYTERRRTRDEGGKGGGSQRVIEYLYSTNVAIGVCANTIDRVNKIIADGKVLYSYDWFDEWSVETCWTETTRRRFFSGTLTLTTIRTPTDTIFAYFHTGDTFTVAGLDDSTNNGTWTVHASGGYDLQGYDGDGWPLYQGSWVTFVNASGVQNIEDQSCYVTWTGALFNGEMVGDVRIYTPDVDQAPDTLMDARTGDTGNAYKDITYIVLETLELEPYGNRVPNFQIDVRETGRRSVRSAVEMLLLRGGLTASEYDVSGIVDGGDDEDELRGYTVSGIQTTEQALLPIMTAYNLLAREEGGALHIFTRGTQTAIEITENDLTARMEGDAPRPKVQIEDFSETDLPSQLTLNYINSNRYERASVTETKRVKTYTQATAIDLPLHFLTPDARRVAGRLLWSAWRSRQKIRFSLPPRYQDVRENSLLTVPADGQEYEVLVTSVSRGANYLLEIEGVVEDVQSYTVIDDDHTTESLDYLDTPSVIELEVLDIPAMADAEAMHPGYYLAGRNASVQEPWRGFHVYDSSDNTVYEHLTQVHSQSVMGYLTSDVYTVHYDQTVEATAATVDSGDWQQHSGIAANGVDSTTVTELRTWDSRSTAQLTFNFTGMAPGEYAVYINWGYPAAPSPDAVRITVYDEGVEANISRIANQTRTWDYMQQIYPAIVDFQTSTGRYWVALGVPEGQLFTIGSAGTAAIVVTPQDTTADTYQTRIAGVRLQRISSDPLSGASPYYWDRLNSITVYLENGTLETKTEAEIFAGANHALFGNEIIAFRDVELTAENTYELSMLLRGQRNTESHMVHSAGDRFILLDERPRFQVANYEQIGKTTYLKAVAPGAALADVDEGQFELTGTNMRSFSPVQLEAAASGSNIVLTWIRRSKAVGSIFASGLGRSNPEEYPLLFENERFNADDGSGNVVDKAMYRIDILDGDTDEVVRNAVAYDETYTYTSDDISTDGFSSTDPVTFQVSQVTRGISNGGRGNIAQVETTIP